MKKANLTIVAAIIATFVFSMIAFQPTPTEASNNVSPTMTPSPRTKRPIAIQSPKPIQSPITRTKTRKSGVREGGANDTTFRKRKPKKPNNFQEVSGIGMEVTSIKKNTKRKSAQYNPKEVGIDKIKAKKPANFTSAEGRSMSFELRKKRPRKRKN
ncbi:MAG: hypothetical protein MUC29_14655 [Pyrinomonadaceae bacterium]|nr:hypothetical protein [Pyrinomonadaceae bacterium]